MLKRYFPFLEWFEKKRKGSLKADIISGLTVAMVLIPQSIAYAQLAGLPPYYGLYAAFLPPIAASLFSTCPQLNTGPVAVVSLMTSTALAPLATAGSSAYIGYAILLAFVVGAIQFLLGSLKLGMVVNFLSHPVVNGFTNAAALIIATSQLPGLLGVQVDSAQHHYETLARTAMAALVYVHWPAVGMAALALAIMIGLKKLNPKIPGVLVAVVITTIISWAASYEKNVNVKIGDFKTPRVVSEIREFNSLVAKNEDLSRKRIALGEAKDRALKEHGKKSIEALEGTAAFEVAGLEMSELAEEIYLVKSKLRAYRFAESVAGGGGTFRVTGKNEKPGRVWRLKVGVKPLDENKLLMIGGGTVMGDIPGGAPKPAVPKFDVAAMLRLLPIAMIIAVLGFMETIGVAKAMAARTGRMVEPDQELIAQGLANMAGSFGQSYTVSGSFSRTAVSYQAGAVTGFSNIVSSLVVLAVMLFLTKYLYYLPQAVLAAIIMMAVSSLINIKSFVHAHKARRHDGLIGVITFFTTLGFAPHLDKGIMIGVGLSLAYRLLKEMHPDIHFLAKHEDGSFKPADIYNLKPCRHIAVIRFNDSLFFENVSFLEHTIIEVIALMPDLKHIIIAGKGINEIDASGEELLSTLVPRLKDKGLAISFSGLNDESLNVLKSTGLYKEIGEGHFFLNVQAAVDALYEEAHKDSTEPRCPLLTPLPADESDFHVTHFGHKRKKLKFIKKAREEDTTLE